MLDLVVAFVQEVIQELKGTLAVELRYQCKVHSQKGPSALTCKPHEVLQGRQSECAFSKAPRAKVGCKNSLPCGGYGACWAGKATNENKMGKTAG